MSSLRLLSLPNKKMIFGLRQIPRVNIHACISFFLLFASFIENRILMI